MSIRKTLTCLVVLFMPVWGMGQKLWTLSDCIQYALENNIQIKQAEIDSKIIEERLTQSKYELLPDFSVSGSDRLNYGKSVVQATNQFAESRIRSSNFQANAQIDLFKGFQNVNSIKKNRLDFMASRYDLDKIKNNIALDVTNAYLLILFNEEIADISRQQTEITKLQVVRIEKMVASGSLPKGSLLELQAQLADEELQMVNAENQVKLAHLDLLQLLQKEGDTELEILKPTFDSVQLAMEIKPASEVYKTSMTLMPQIKSAELKLQSSEKNLSLSRSNRSPTISFGGNLGTGYSQAIPSDYFSQMNDNAYRNFGLTLFVPIFSKYSIQQSINQAKLQMQRANYSLMLEKNNLRQNVEKAWADAEASLKSYYANKKSLEALQESFKYAEKRFEAGMINSVEYNTNKNNLRRAESELTQSKYEYIFKRKILDFFQGIEISF